MVNRRNSLTKTNDEFDQWAEQTLGQVGLRGARYIAVGNIPHQVTVLLRVQARRNSIDYQQQAQQEVEQAQTAAQHRRVLVPTDSGNHLRTVSVDEGPKTRCRG